MIRLRSIVISAIFILIYAEGWSQVVDLAHFLDTARVINPTLQDNMNQVQLADLEMDKINAEFNKPKISLSTDIMNAPVFNGIGYDEAITNGALYATLINARQPLLNGGKGRASLLEQQNVKSQARYNRDLATHQLDHQITQAYIQCYTDQEKIRVGERVLQAMKEEKSVIELLSRQGITRISDVQLFNIEILDKEILQKNMFSALKNDLYKLNHMCGLQDTLVPEFKEPDLQVASSSLSFIRSRFREKFTLDSMNIAISGQVSDSRYKPSLFVYGNAGINSSTLQAIQEKVGFSAGISLNIPIYEGNQRKIQHEQNTIRQATIKNYEHFEQAQFELAGWNTQDQFRAVQEQIELLTTQSNDYQTLITMYQDEIKAGIVSVTEYLVVLRNYLERENQLLDLKREEMLLITNYQYLNW